MPFVLSILLIAGAANAGMWKKLCRTQLSGDDPYQYEELTVDHLLELLFRDTSLGNYDFSLINEAKDRLVLGSESQLLSEEDQIMLTAVLARVPRDQDLKRRTH